MSTEGHHPDLFWYGIHGVEPLFTIMGTGCESVSRTDSTLSTVVVGKWKDGRTIVQGSSYGATTFSPINNDVTWVQERTSAPVRGN